MRGPGAFYCRSAGARGDQGRATAEEGSRGGQKGCACAIEEGGYHGSRLYRGSWIQGNRMAVSTAAPEPCILDPSL